MGARADLHQRGASGLRAINPPGRRSLERRRVGDRGEGFAAVGHARGFGAQRDDLEDRSILQLGAVLARCSGRVGEIDGLAPLVEEDAVPKVASTTSLCSVATENTAG